ncbi:MAG TPA: hypothetical protein VK106_07055 [Balneolaceae bacterium]|nr:hypothetical protein [Balneolaceae bacterium]
MITVIKYLKNQAFLLLAAAVFLIAANVNAQEINFGKFGNYSLSVTELSGQGLDFGNVISGNGAYNVELANAKILSLTGMKYLDVFISIDADDELLLNKNPACAGDPSCSVPFTLQAAYANTGMQSIAKARFFNVNSNSVDKQIPILRRKNGPPGPPPPPPHKGYNPEEYNETAYIYLFGSINVGSVDAGTYTGNITVTVIYN